MKLICDFEKVEMDGQVIAVGTAADKDGNNIMLRLNETASLIFDLLKDDITEEQIVSELKKTYIDENSQIAPYVHEFIENLKEKQIVK